MSQTVPLPARRPINRPWGRRIFESKTARNGGIVRRSVAAVRREIGEDALRVAARARGYHVVRIGPQYLIICCEGPIELLE